MPHAHRRETIMLTHDEREALTARREDRGGWWRPGGVDGEILVCFAWGALLVALLVDATVGPLLA
jgi:hypothetical protein